jgi:hypothetical protein
LILYNFIFVFNIDQSRTENYSENGGHRNLYVMQPLMSSGHRNSMDAAGNIYNNLYIYLIFIAVCFIDTL